MSSKRTKLYTGHLPMECSTVSSSNPHFGQFPEFTTPMVLIYLILSTKLMLRSTTNFFILNMAMADFMYLLIIPAFIHESSHQNFELGHLWCRCSGFLMNSLRLTSVFTLVTISLDRLRAVLLPLKSPLTMKMSVPIVTFVWSVAFLLSVPQIIYRKYAERVWADYVEKYCSEIPQDLMKWYWIMLLGLMVWIPVTLMIISYSIIFCKLRHLIERQRNVHPIRARQKKQILKMLFIVLVIFCVSWLPFNIFVLVDEFKAEASKNSILKRYKIYRYVALYMSFWSSAMNPFVYAFASENYKRALKVKFFFLL
ncbi:unnamed protein product, partial [Cyprideis torosa]